MIKEMKWAFVWYMCAAIIGVIAVLICSRAHAHDHSRPDLDQWYKSLTNANGVGCCDDQEATRVEDADWQSACKGGECHYQVFIANRWWDVPKWAVVEGPNKAGVTLVWPVYYWNNGKPEDGLHDVFIRCFEPGPGG